MKKEIILISVVGMFLLTCISVVSAININNENEAGEPIIVTVDDDGKECQNANFGSIQAALNSAGDWGNIKVYPGTYYENIVINYDWVVLHSTDGPQVTKIIGDGGATIKINGNWANVHGFTVSNSAQGGIGININGPWANVYNNIITGNSLGLKVTDEGDWAYVRHNDFISNGAHAQGSASYDNGHSGNYWDTYTGSDSDGDGIGDTPYGKDDYPLMRSWWDNVEPTAPTELTGPSNGIMGKKYTFTTSGGTDTDGTKVYYTFDWGTDHNHWHDRYTSSGIVANGESVSVETGFYAWGVESVTYTIKVKTRDLYDYGSEWFEETHDITVTNTKPNNPSEINGPITVKTGKTAEFTVTTTDPDGHDIFYWVDWGDSDDPEHPWEGEGYAKSGETMVLKHKWAVPDNYTIRVKVEDRYDLEADEISTFDIAVTKSRTRNLVGENIFERIVNNYPLLARLLQSPIFDKLLNI